MFTGCGTALVTPFQADGSRWMKRRCASWCGGRSTPGIDFLVPCGTTGESPTLTREEHLRVVEITVEEAGGEGPGAGRRGRLQHARSDRTRAELRTASARTASFP